MSGDKLVLSNVDDQIIDVEQLVLAVDSGISVFSGLSLRRLRRRELQINPSLFILFHFITVHLVGDENDVLDLLRDDILVFRVTLDEH